MKNKFYHNFCAFFVLSIMSVFFLSSNKSRFSIKEIQQMENEALSGSFDSAMALSDYYGIDLQDVILDMFWTSICFENNPSEGSWNFAHMNFGTDEKSLRFQYLFFLSEEAEMQRINSKFFEITKEQFIEFHKKHPDFKFADDNLEYSSVTNENYQYFYDKAFSGSGLAALKIAQFYEKKNTQNIYADYKRLLDVGCVYKPAEEVLPLFWLRIGAQNGNKECMKKYAEILKQSDDEYDKIRSEFWEKKSKS